MADELMVPEAERPKPAWEKLGLPDPDSKASLMQGIYDENKQRVSAAVPADERKAALDKINDAEHKAGMRLSAPELKLAVGMGIPPSAYLDR